MSTSGAADRLMGVIIIFSTRNKEFAMKYLCLVYSAESLLDTMPDSDCLAYDESIRKSGH